MKVKTETIVEKRYIGGQFYRLEGKNKPNLDLQEDVIRSRLGLPIPERKFE